MKIENRIDLLRHFTAYCLMIAMFATTSMIAFAAPERNSAMGELTVSGASVDGSGPAVMVNGEKALSGRTVFSSSTITTTETSSAAVKLGKLGSVELAPNSVLSLSFDDRTILGTLSSGRIIVTNAEGVDVKIQTNKGIVGNSASAAGVLNVDANALPAQDDDDTVSDSSQMALILVFAGVVAGTVAYLLLRDDGDDVGTSVSPVR
jgi:hypothetical protein